MICIKMDLALKKPTKVDMPTNQPNITFLIQSCLVFSSFSANLLHLFIMWLIVSFLSPHNIIIIIIISFSLCF